MWPFSGACGATVWNGQEQHGEDLTAHGPKYAPLTRVCAR